jgi:hypothetical protein
MEASKPNLSFFFAYPSSSETGIKRIRLVELRCGVPQHLFIEKWPDNPKR